MAEIWVEHNDQAERDERRARPIIQGTTEFKAYQARPNLANKQRLQQVEAAVFGGLQAETAARIEAEKKAGREYKPFAQEAFEAVVKLHTDILPREAYNKLGLNKVTGKDFGELTNQGQSYKNPFTNSDTASEYARFNAGSVGQKQIQNAEIAAARSGMVATAGGLTRSVANEYTKTETRLRDLMPKGRGREAVQEGEFYNEL